MWRHVGWCIVTFLRLFLFHLQALNNLYLWVFMFARCINSIKTLFIIPTDAHNYKITGMLKTIKIPIIAPTCFGSRRNHHQGAISCLSNTTIMILLCSSLMTWSALWRHTSLLCINWNNFYISGCSGWTVIFDNALLNYKSAMGCLTIKNNQRQYQFCM